jgi:hypothetical protein
MRRCLLVLLVCLGSVVPAWTDEPSFPCVRFIQSDQRWILDVGARESPTLRGLAAALCETDVIAYVRIDLRMRSNIAGTCALVGASTTTRLLSIRLNSRLTHGVDLIATLSHELEHALRIARASWVRSPDDVLVLQRLLSPRAPHAVEAERAEAATRRDLANASLQRQAR